MTALRTDDIENLLAKRAGPCVSLYMPTHRKGREVQQDPIRFKNLLRQAESELEGVAIPGASATEFLKPARDLLLEPSFWEHASDGLAVFLAPGFARTYRLPTMFREMVSVSGAFHLKPLLSILGDDGQFYVLALSKNEVRLLQGTRDSVGELEPEGLPKNLKETLWADAPEKSLQHHGSTAPSGGGRATIYHGHGGGADVEKTNLERYFRRVDEGLVEFLGGESAPLVLAGVEHYFSIYRNVNHYPYLMDGGVRGNPDELTSAELHQSAWRMVAPIFLQHQEDALARYRSRAGQGTTSVQIEEIVPAAHHGRVEALFVALGKQRWGAFIPDGMGSVILHDDYEQGDRDLLDVAAAATLRTGGAVYVLPPDRIPADLSHAAALLRY